MSNRKIVDYDPHTGIIETYHRNADNTFTIHETQDCQGLIDANKEARNSASKGFKGEFHHMARISLVMWAAWWQELGSDPGHPSNKAWLKRRLNDISWNKLRMKEGKM